MEQLSRKRFYNAESGRRYGAVPTAGYPPVIQALLADPRTDINLRDSQVGYTPLMKALADNEDDVVAWLLAAGADPNLTAYDGKFSALGIALEAMGRKYADGKPLPSTVRQFESLLATKRVKLDIQYDGKTALTGALSSCDIHMVKRLLEAGANPNAADVGKRTPLIVSIESSILNPRPPQYLECVRTIAAWPSVDYTALYAGKTALQMALYAGRADLVDILEKK